ncbi:hypothetical protein HPB50_013712 [Hyalomma asiaticum]|uniref:Uncharacterized protein n=1 Tax=Hyalomma asiaticum TaxID=266040 RepID=A0ACB7TM85_HYAAI|nr:hypothetical protein HPB50_013712 [Hyalomma asiaticum]
MLLDVKKSTRERTSLLPPRLSLSSFTTPAPSATHLPLSSSGTLSVTERATARISGGPRVGSKQNFGPNPKVFSYAYITFGDEFTSQVGERRRLQKQAASATQGNEGSFQSSVGREEHIGMAQSAVSNTYEVTEAIIISVAARAARRKLVDFPPTPWLPRMRRRRRLRYSATSQAC